MFILCKYLYLSFLFFFFRSYWSQYEIFGNQQHFLLQFKQSWSGWRRRRGICPAQPTRGHGGSAIDCRLPWVCGLPAPLCWRAREPHTAAELRTAHRLVLPVSLSLTHLHKNAHYDRKDTCSYVYFCTYTPKAHRRSLTSLGGSEMGGIRRSFIWSGCTGYKIENIYQP